MTLQEQRDPVPRAFNYNRITAYVGFLLTSWVISLVALVRPQDARKDVDHVGVGCILLFFGLQGIGGFFGGFAADVKGRAKVFRWTTICLTAGLAGAFICFVGAPYLFFNDTQMFAATTPPPPTSEQMTGGRHLPGLKTTWEQKNLRRPDSTSVEMDERLSDIASRALHPSLELGLDRESTRGGAKDRWLPSYDDTVTLEDRKIYEVKGAGRRRRLSTLGASLDTLPVYHSPLKNVPATWYLKSRHGVLLASTSPSKQPPTYPVPLRVNRSNFLSEILPLLAQSSIVGPKLTGQSSINGTTTTFTSEPPSSKPLSSIAQLISYDALRRFCFLALFFLSLIFVGLAVGALYPLVGILISESCTKRVEELGWVCCMQGLGQLVCRITAAVVYYRNPKASAEVISVASVGVLTVVAAFLLVPLSYSVYDTAIFCARGNVGVTTQTVASNSSFNGDRQLQAWLLGEEGRYSENPTSRTVESTNSGAVPLWTNSSSDRLSATATIYQRTSPRVDKSTTDVVARDPNHLSHVSLAENQRTRLIKPQKCGFKWEMHWRTLRRYLPAFWSSILGCAIPWLMLDATYYGTGACLRMAGECIEGLLLVMSYLSAAVVLSVSLIGYLLTAHINTKLTPKLLQILGFAIQAFVFFGLALCLYSISHAKLDAPAPSISEFLGASLLYDCFFRFFNCVPNLTTFLIPLDAFPTKVRGTFVGFVVFCARFGSLLGLSYASYVAGKSQLGLLGLCTLSAVLSAAFTRAFTPNVTPRNELLAKLDARYIGKIDNKRISPLNFTNGLASFSRRLVSSARRNGSASTIANFIS